MSDLMDTGFARPTTEVDRQVQLGQVEGGGRWGLDELDLLTDVLIAGAIGEGKTSLIGVMGREAARILAHVRMVMFDYKGTMKKLVPHIPGAIVLDRRTFRLKPLEVPPYVDPREWRDCSSEALTKLDFELYQGSTWPWRS